jgi:hypothetical protein
VAVPVGSAEQPFIFQETTADFQEVTLQGQVTYRVSEPKRLAQLLDYTLAPNGRTYASEDPEKLPERIVQRTHVLTRAALQKLPLREAIRASDQLVSAVQAGLTASQEITSLGLEVLGLSILAVKPTPDTARALEAETRESLLREADEAIYARRNSAVEHGKRKWTRSAPCRRKPACSTAKPSKPTSDWRIAARAWSGWPRTTPGPRRTRGPTGSRAR